MPTLASSSKGAVRRSPPTAYRMTEQNGLPLGARDRDQRPSPRDQRERPAELCATILQPEWLQSPGTGRHRPSADPGELAAQTHCTTHRAIIEHGGLVTHNPKVAGSNPAPATNEKPSSEALFRDIGKGLCGVSGPIFYTAGWDAPHRLGRAGTVRSGTPCGGTVSRLRPTVPGARRPPRCGT